MKIATHDSGTGEKPKGLLSYLITPFAKTQNKTIKQQYEAGCRYFDIRVKYIKNKLVLAHGLWHSKTTFDDILKYLSDKECIIDIMYEGYPTDEELSLFNKTVENIPNNIVIHQIGIRNPWTITYIDHTLDYDYGFQTLNNLSWHRYIPIPWLWDKIKGNHNFNDEKYLMVDFL